MPVPPEFQMPIDPDSPFWGSKDPIMEEPVRKPEMPALTVIA
jgi:hypothetical protein